MSERSARAPHLLLAVVAICLTAACTPARTDVSAAPVPAAPPPATAAEIAAVADLMRLEDTRTFDEARLRQYASLSSARVRARAATALARLRRPESTALLLSLVADPDTQVSANAAFALGQVGDTAAVAGLIALLDPASVNTRSTVAVEAAYALGKLRSEAAQQALLAFLQQADVSTTPSEVVGSALLGVWRLRRPADLAPIVRWTASPDPEVRGRALYAITRRPEPTHLPLLLSLARDPAPAVRANAIRGLTGASADSARIPRDSLLGVLLPAARDADYATRINAVRSLGTFPQPPSLELLGSLLTSADRHLAFTALESLGRLGTRAASVATPLVGIVSDEAAPISLRQSALEALASVSRPDAERVGRAHVRSASWRLRAGAAKALAGPGGMVSAELRALINDPDPRVAALALQSAVYAVGDSVVQVRSLLAEQLLAPDPFVRMVSLTALARLREPDLLPLLLDAYQRAQRDSVNDAALASLDALGSLRGPAFDPAHAFFARFSRPADYLIRRKASEIFGPLALAAWGEALPLDSTGAIPPYEELARSWWAEPRLEHWRPELLIRMDVGTLRVRMFGDDAPLTAHSFVTLARRAFFDGQEWPRVVPNFVVQGGDPRGDTNGGPGYVIRDEISRRRYQAGTVGMALSGPDTGGSQFFATHSAQPHLDGIYAVFGEVVEGAELLTRIIPGDIIRSVTVAP